MGGEQQRLLDLLANASRHARLGDYGEAAHGINACVIEFQRFMEHPQGPPPLIELGPKVTYSLETLLMMIERKDWVAAADIIDYELIPLVKETFSIGNMSSHEL
jgi:hypothetical protein